MTSVVSPLPGLYCHPVVLTGISIFSTSIGACFSTYIPLMRLVQTVHHSKRRGGNILREGWLLHHTNIDPLVRHTQLVSLIVCAVAIFSIT